MEDNVPQFTLFPCHHTSSDWGWQAVKLEEPCHTSWHRHHAQSSAGLHHITISEYVLNADLLITGGLCSYVLFWLDIELEKAALHTIILNTFLFVLADPPITQLEDMERLTGCNRGIQRAGITDRIQWEITCKELPISARRASGNNQEILSTFSNYLILISCMRKTQTHTETLSHMLCIPQSCFWHKSRIWLEKTWWYIQNIDKVWCFIACGKKFKRKK